MYKEHSSSRTYLALPSRNFIYLQTNYLHLQVSSVLSDSKAKTRGTHLPSISKIKLLTMEALEWYIETNAFAWECCTILVIESSFHSSKLSSGEHSNRASDNKFCRAQDCCSIFPCWWAYHMWLSATILSGSWVCIFPPIFKLSKIELLASPSIWIGAILLLLILLPIMRALL
jgi:hypothetical protein